MNRLSTWAHNESFARLLRLLPAMVTALLVAGLAILLASLFWLLFAPPSQPPLQAVPKRTHNGSPVEIKNYGNTVAALHLFGYEKKTPAPVAVVKPKKTVPLNLELHGIVARKGQQSYAIIASKNQTKQDIYTVGEEPQPGVKIDRILPRKVIIKHAGKLQELSLPEEQVSKAAHSGLPPATAPVPASRFPRINAAAPVANSSDLPEDDLSALRDSLTNNPDKILEIASISEAKDKDGNLIGFRLSPGKHRKLFRKLGLRPGDVVTQVNGVQLDSPAKGLMIMNELSSAASITLTLKRGDQEVTIEKAF